MIKLKSILESIVLEGGKLFGPSASRITTDEMYSVFDELRKKIAKKFDRFTLTTALPTKKDHGDIDLIVLPKKGESVKDIVTSTLKGGIVKNESGQLMVNSNGNIFSILYSPKKLDKQVHIDFITVKSEEDFETKENYLSYNDFSSIVGIMARRLNFSYGTEGFFKVIKDNAGQHKYILITKNLRDGLKILGFRKVDTNFSNIKSEDDIVEFIKTSPLFDISYLSVNLNKKDRNKLKPDRKAAKYIRDELLKSNQHRSIEDEDYFFKSLFPPLYAEVENKKKEILALSSPNSSKYTGDWIVKTFNLKPGPIVGSIKNVIFKKFGDKLDSVSEETVVAVIKKLFSLNESLNELDYEGAVGIQEIMAFYAKANDEQIAQFEECATRQDVNCVKNLIKLVTGMSMNLVK